MIKAFKYLIFITFAIGILFPAAVYAREGDCGYEGGISSGEAPGRTSFEYREICFISGEPVVFKGLLTVKKAAKQNSISTTYTYNLKNVDKSAVLTRSIVMNTTLTKKSNGQTVEDSVLGGKPAESIKINGVTYTLSNYEFTRTCLIDPKPAINYFSGNIWSRKTYTITAPSSGGTAGGGSVSTEITGRFYGYDQYWGATEVQIHDFKIQSEQKKGDTLDNWGGQARINLSSSTTRQIKYLENEPEQISFKGGYIETQYNDSILEYTSTLPEFDSKGISTDNGINVRKSLELESFPIETRLPVADLAYLKGHPSETDIKILMSLEIFELSAANFLPEQYMTRAEFLAALGKAAKEVPADPVFSKNSTRTTVKKQAAAAIVSPFRDVPAGSSYFETISNAYKRGLITGKEGSLFKPGDYIILADAITMMVRALGLEALSPKPAAVTAFKDNDLIPAYSRSAVYTAELIGLIGRDAKGYLNPGVKLTKGRTAALINKFVEYMRNDIKKDYSKLLR